MRRAGQRWIGRARVLVLAGGAALPIGGAPLAIGAQEPVAWGTGDVVFHTFSIAGIDPATGESGVAVTTRVPCVGNGVPWVRAGVGAVATQASTRTEYGAELLDLLAAGVSPEEALAQRVAADPMAESRQVGVISVDGRSAQHTGSRPQAWAGHRAGPNYVTQGNILVGPEVVDAVAASFEATEGSGRHLADRLIEALWAGQRVGGDARVGRAQSAAVVVADPRDGVSRRADKQTVHINVCEHPEPVGEMRRIYNTISQTLGFRELQIPSGEDIWQLKLILHGLGLLHPEQAELERGNDATRYTPEAIDAVDRFRREAGLGAPGSTPSGFVDAATVEALWSALERSGRAAAVRERIRDVVQVRR